MVMKRAYLTKKNITQNVMMMDEERIERMEYQPRHRSEMDDFEEGVVRHLRQKLQNKKMRV